ncbi:hypothetical protein BJ875DRAFT_279061 [Amylocarpus encephaloides]|uniref:Uncharacterized protein n=1 Tax=Amylocarpus encephaloides TaxID=45428 RepID=A0A9P7Y7C6_9HELO|nr:hypothetical protein BJ875DRAFT_279061 [Amylocarpus encephaloides]
MLNFTASRNTPNRSDEHEFPGIEELLLGTQQKSLPVSSNLDGDDPDGFIDIDKLLSGMPQKGAISVDPNYSGIAVDMVDNRTRGGSTSSSSRSTTGNSQDPNTISDDGPMADESETDYSDHDVDFRAKSDSDRLYVIDSELAVSDSFGVGATFNFQCLSTHRQDHDNDYNDVADKTQLCLSVDRPISASLKPGPNTKHASNVRVKTDVTQQSTSSPNLDGAKQVEDKGCNAFVKGNI